jgi:hypothetical protein
MFFSKSFGVVDLLASAAMLASGALACSPTLPRSGTSACVCPPDRDTNQAGNARATSAPAPNAAPVDPSIERYVAREFKVEGDAPLPRANE